MGKGKEGGEVKGEESEIGPRQTLIEMYCKTRPGSFMFFVTEF